MLGDDTSLPAPYLRAYLAKCVLASTLEDGASSHLTLYPTLLVYDSGVLIVEFRMIGPKAVTSLTDFITSGVNLFRYKFGRVEVTPGNGRDAVNSRLRDLHRALNQCCKPNSVGIALQIPLERRTSVIVRCPKGVGLRQRNRCMTCDERDSPQFPTASPTFRTY